MNKNNHPLVAVGVPVYNGEKYLAECLESILKQTYHNWECVISVNKSTDNSLGIAREFTTRDNRFKIFEVKEFCDLVENWNNTFIHRNPEAVYFKMVQADDWIFEENLERNVSILNRNPNIGVCSSYRLNSTRVDMDGLDIQTGNIFDGKEILYKQLTKQIDISGTCTTLMFSVAYLTKLDTSPNIFVNINHPDTELFYDIINISKVGFVYQVLSYTRRHDQAGTFVRVYQLGTLYQLHESMLYKFKGDDIVLNKQYRKQRLDYAYFYLKSKFLNNKAAVSYHKKNLRRWFTINEYFVAVLSRNKFIKIIKRVFLTFNAKKK